MSTEAPDTSNRIVTGSAYDHGEPRTWEITWINGHTEKISGHQVMTTSGRFRATGEGHRTPARVEIHGVVNGRWELIFSGRSEEITAVQLIAS